MSYFVALLLGFMAQGAMGSRLVKGEVPFAKVFVFFGILGSFPFLGWLMYNFNSFMSSDLQYTPNIEYDMFIDSLTLPSTVAGAYWLLVFIGLWRSAGRLSTGKMIVSRYFSVTWLSSAAACFFIIAKGPFVIFIAAYFFAKKYWARNNEELANC
ncbi:hypothetical protein [Modicisalibacter xianhensis]|uniref:hypothetical protein n=1 Tax=Modicisalibacter xianhensis TaxID=442341 RepID=UPI001063BF2C|nr:hypothetical protein [Halomonas xianhensis]